MPVLKSKLLDRNIIAENTMEFILEKPKGMDFLAGQNINIKLAELFYADKKGQRRTFTIASSPDENELIIATRMTGSGFKKTLAELPLGSEIEFIGPNGKFYLYEESEPVVFIAGGIGVTPFRSMLLDVLAKGKKIPITLFYSNATLKRSTYHDLFKKLTDSLPAFKYVPILTRAEIWDGENERISIDMIRKFIPNLISQDYYLCGPPAMVDGLKNILFEEGIPADKVRFESFWGY